MPGSDPRTYEEGGGPVRPRCAHVEAISILTLPSPPPSPPFPFPPFPPRPPSLHQVHYDQLVPHNEFDMPAFGNGRKLRSYQEVS